MSPFFHKIVRTGGLTYVVFIVAAVGLFVSHQEAMMKTSLLPQSAYNL